MENIENENKQQQNEEQEMIQKQELLQKEIIDKNHDKEKFIEFCKSQKENGDDLTNWTFSELSAIVNEFTTKVSKENEEQQQKQKDELKVENVRNIEKTTHDHFMPKNDIEVICRKLEPSPLNNQQINVIVQNPKEIEIGAFHQNYILYEVVTEPLGYMVTRRYSDFDWLRKTLEKFYPFHNIPPLPHKKLGDRRFDRDFIMKRMRLLNTFINAIVQDETYKAHSAVVSFLSMTDHHKFEEKMKELNTHVQVSYIEEIATLEGKIFVNHEEGNDKYFVNVRKFYDLQNQLLDNLNKSLRSFCNSLQNASNDLETIEKDLEVLHVLNTRILMKEQITKSYEELSFFFQNWKNIILKQQNLFKTRIKEFYNYVGLEGQNYVSILQHREDLKTKYEHDHTKLEYKKEKIFNTKDIAKFELNPNDDKIDKDKLIHDKAYAFEHICYKERQQIKILYDMLGYANHMGSFELKKMLNGYCSKFINNLQQFDSQLYPTLTDEISTWTNIETFVQSCLADKGS